MFLLTLILLAVKFLATSSQEINSVCTSAECVQTAGRIIQRMGLNRTTNPCENMYNYACGGFIQPENLTPGTQKISPLGEVEELIYKRLNYLLRRKKDDKVYECGSAEEKAKRFYRACMDSPDNPYDLRNFLIEIGSWPLDKNWRRDTSDLEEAVAKVLSYPDVARNGLMEIIISDIPGVCPKRTFNVIQPTLWIKVNENITELMYREFFIFIANKVGVSDQVLAENYATTMWKIENDIASLIQGDLMKLIETRDFSLVKFGSFKDPEDDKESRDRINYKQLLATWLGKEKKLTDDHKIIVSPANYLEKLSAVLEKYTYEEIFTYNAWCALRSVETLTRPVGIVSSKVHNSMNIFEFGTTGRQIIDFPYLSAAMEQSNAEARSRMCQQGTNRLLEFATAAMYSKHYQMQEAKASVEKLVNDMIAYFPQYIDQIQWIDQDSKERVKNKVKDMVRFVGYPDWIMNQEKLNEHYMDFYVTHDHAENMINFGKWRKQKQINLLDTVASRNNWEDLHIIDSPLRVNAYNQNLSNALFIHLGLLHEPFYHSHPKSLFYGSIGYTIGHEIFHGLVEEGRMYDEALKKNSLFNNKTESEYQKRAKCFSDYYSKLNVDGLKTDGKFVLADSLCDNGGLSLAFDFYKKWKSDQMKAELPVNDQLPGIELSGEQLFFLAASQPWCTIFTKEALMNEMKNNVHPLANARVLGMIGNSKQFSYVFKCEETAKMKPLEKCKLW